MKSHISSRWLLIFWTISNLFGCSCFYGSANSFAMTFSPSRNEIRSIYRSHSLTPFQRVTRSGKFKRQVPVFSSDDQVAPTDDDIIIRSLETSLGKNNIPVPEGAIQQMIDRREWIYLSETVENLLEMLNKEQLYSVFNYQHQLQSASKLFKFLSTKKKKVSVVYGHKA